MRKLIKEVGNWVDGERFFDREQESRELAELLVEGASVLLVAPRRVGKTSLVRESGRRLQDRFQFFFLDVQDCRGPADVLVHVATATRGVAGLWERTRQVFENALDGVEAVGSDELAVRLRASLAGGWAERGSRLLGALAEARADLVISLDELPILLYRMMTAPGGRLDPEGVREVDRFMSWLRRMTIEHRGRIRFIVTGSIGIEPVLRRVGLSATLNALTPFHLEPWSPETARACLHALASQYEVPLDVGASQRMVDRLGLAVPHHVQMFFGHVLAAFRRERPAVCTSELVDRVYEESMLGTRGHAELSHMEERLKMVLGEERMPLALDLLSEAAVVGRLAPEAARQLAQEAAPAGEPPEACLRHVLDILLHDGYLRRDDGGWTFASRLLRDWWKRRFELGYVPVDRRG